MNTVKIGPAFFKKEFTDYSNWRWAYVREAMQNCVDAPGTTVVKFNVNTVDGNTIISFENNGTSMDEDIIMNKLFALGESGKNFAGSVGGFGKAKVLLYFAHDSYQITTGNFIVAGSGGDFEVIQSENHFSGTRSVVAMDGDHTQAICDQIRSLCFYAQTTVEISLNGEVLEANHNKGSRRRDLGFGKVYTSKRATNKMVVRISGIPMFVNYASVNRLVTVELEGNSSDVLTSNRDGLIYPYSGELSNFVTELAVDKRSALSAKQPRYIHYGGDKLAHTATSRVNTASFMMGVDLADPDATDETITTTIDAGSGEIVYDAEKGDVVWQDECAHDFQTTETETTTLVETRMIRVDSEFVIKNETNLAVPSYYRPECDEFSAYSQKLIRIWSRLMLQMYRTMGHSGNFAVGFIFQDDGTMAEYEKADFGNVYYIAPAAVKEQNSTRSKSFKKAWKLTDRGLLISTAAHEFVHGACGYGIHGEGYSSKYTEVMGTVLDRKKDFSWCFR